MQLTRKMICRFALTLLMQIVFLHAAFAVNDPTLTKPLLGSRDSVKLNYSSQVIDFALLTNPSGIDTTHFIKNLVSVGIEEESKYYVQTDFTVTLTLRIKRVFLNGQSDSVDKVFTINYKKNEGEKYNALQYFAFENAKDVTIKIIGIDSGSVNWPVTRVLRVDNKLTATRDYKFNCSTSSIQNLNATLDAANSELAASWNSYDGSTEYDLEWAWIDSTALSEYKGTGGSFLQDKIFENNASRVTISNTLYRIPLLYDGGGLVFVRVRPAQIKHNGQRVEGLWTSTPVYYIYAGHENDLNWQANTSFAEEGKRKSVVQYFDGTLRSRQTVTKDNTTNTTVVAESFYDYQGRPVIQVLPAPTLNTIIQYSQNVNKAVNYDGYPKWVYDKLDANASVCGNPASPLSTATGTARYYSPNNEKVNDPATGYNVNKYIPSSEGPVSGEAYPFTETRFTPDGRIAAQSGVGYTHRLSSNHETKYYYESPAQEELDALFGTDAGYASHYFKNIVKDANGQYSVSYVDMHGRTIATALAGDAPKQENNVDDRLEPLPSINSRNFTRQLIDDETNRIVGRSIISTKTLTVLKTGNYNFNYQLSPEQLSVLSCSSQSICYDCIYNLKITIAADCNTDPRFPYVVLDSNFRVSDSLRNTLCNPGTGLANRFFSKAFGISLPEGSYTVSKVLTLSDSAQSVYRDVFMANDTCRTFQSFYDTEYQLLVSKSNCAISCDSCKASIGLTLAAFRQKFVQQSGMSEPLPQEIVDQLQTSYNEALENCNRICNPNNNDGMDAIRGIQQIMLLDMTPPYGQYAVPEESQSNLFNIFRNPSTTDPTPTPFRNPKKYTVGSAPVPDSYRNEFGLIENPVPSADKNVFSQQFKTPWAEQLLAYHPEFCKLKATLENLPSTYQFEATLTNLKTYAEAKNAQYLNPLANNVISIINADPFFSGVGSQYKTEMINTKMKGITINPDPTNTCSLSPMTITMWQLAYSTVFCRNITDNANCNLAQRTCLINAQQAPVANQGTSCTADWDMVWTTFRTLYLTERKKYISMYLKSTAVCNPDREQVIKDHRYQLRFMDAGNIDMGNYSSSELEHLFSDIAEGNVPGALATAHQLELAQYDSTCRGYADSWIAQLRECPELAGRWSNQATLTADSTWIVSRLVDICKKGSDQYHYLGSSSLNPSDPPIFDNTNNQYYREFPDVIRVFLLSIGNPGPAELCHPYLITAPKPYDKQPAPTNGMVITKPTDCECQRLHDVQFEYQQSGYAGTFSAYMENHYRTFISQGALDTLLSLCSTTNPYPCIFLPKPIVLPPILQCRGTNGTPVKTCITCSDYQALKDSFYIEIQLIGPIENPQTQQEININYAFQNYANHKTGFSKTWIQYVEFGKACDSVQVFTCTSLDSVLQLYYQSPVYVPGQVGPVCRQNFVNFFNSAFGTAYSFDEWMNIFAQSGCPPPDVCRKIISCTGLKALFTEFYDMYGVQIYKNANCSNLFTAFINTRLNSNYTYLQIQSMYQYLCGVSCPLDVCSFPNCFLLTRAYDKFKIDSAGVIPAYCEGAFVNFFNSYFGLDPAVDFDQISKWYNECFASNCGPDISQLCTPVFSCQTLRRIVQAFRDEYGTGVDTLSNCQELFTNYFNQRMQLSYTFQEIQDLFLRLCGEVLDVCTRQFTCAELLIAENTFLSSYTGSNCSVDFTNFFNNYFGTNYSYAQIQNLYSSICGNLISTCHIIQPPTTSENIMQALSDFLVVYPDPGTQLSGNCDMVFAAYFNSKFGTNYTYAQIQTYYASLAKYDLEVCQLQCARYVQFVNDFNTRFNSLKLPLAAKQDLFTFLYHQEFANNIPNTGGAGISYEGDLTYGQISDALQPCFAGPLVTAPLTQSATDPVVLLSMKQAYYLMHPGGLPENCEADFTSWFNLTMQYGFHEYSDLFNHYEAIAGTNAGYICSIPTEEPAISINPGGTTVPTYIPSPPLLCGLNDPIFIKVPTDEDPCKDLVKLAYNAAIEKWELYLDSLRNAFDSMYYHKCMGAKNLESFTVSYDISEYHYTLYYYDQAGNLVRTIPPAGVNARHSDNAFLQSVKTARSNVKNGQPEATNKVVPAHVLATDYRYNSLNQVVAQQTPDAGLSKFWYDRLGRLVISQNSKQQTTNKYSYTLYDILGRIKEVGQLSQNSAMTTTISRDETALQNWLTNQSAEEITRTEYDRSYFDGQGTLCPEQICQRNLRNRVSYTAIYATGNPGVSTAGSHTSATYYSYDIHGNVDTLLQDYNFGVMQSTGNRFKKLVYDYDLISGKVNMVSYQPGWADEFYHRYMYDAENRITEVHTSQDKLVWEKDARYSYYRHGSLARTILGEQQVQGIDYAYTLQGWLKGVNSSSLQAGDDIGQDGVAVGNVASQVAKDAYGFNLNYYGGDYKPISTVVNPFAVVSLPLGIGGMSLYNGNISSMAVNIPKLGTAHLYSYRYDQLNRIVGMDAFTGLNTTSNTWSPVATDNYKERISYDANGNILTYLRNGSTQGSNPLAMDNLTYGYNLVNGKLVNNKLRHVKDAVSAANYSEDIDNQGDDNYAYDQIGNLVQDNAEGISNISWNVYGKIKSITKASGTISYTYDAAGNRVSKTANGKTSIYVRDAGGNVMAIYGTDPAISSGDLLQCEVHLYGSSRLGVYNIGRNVQTLAHSNYPGNISTFIRGNKFFELSNHLCNVLVTISDAKRQHSTDGTTVDYNTAEVVSANDYYPFGMGMPGRKFPTSSNYRYGYNGKEKATEISIEDYDYGARIYEGRIGKWLSTDPQQTKFANLSPYNYVTNNPINILDYNGQDTIRFIKYNTSYPTFTGPSGLRIGGAGRSTFRCLIAQSSGEDVFEYIVINEVVSANGGITVSKPRVTEFYPNNPFSKTGLTTHDSETGLFGQKKDNDFITLAKWASPDLIQYLKNHNRMLYGGISITKEMAEEYDKASKVASTLLIVTGVVQGGIGLIRGGGIEASISILSSGGGTAAEMQVVRIIRRGEKLEDLKNELKGLTWSTGDEHAVVTLASGERAVVSGGPGGIIFKEGQIKNLFGHTHPTSAPPSDADASALLKLGQTTQWVLHGGVVSKVKPKN